MICTGQISVGFRRDTLGFDHEIVALESALALRQQYHAGSERCAYPIGPTEFYNNLSKDSGVRLGSSFQCLRNIRYSRQSDATATIYLDKWADQNTVGEKTPQVLHLTALDAFLHICCATMSQYGQSFPTFIPATIGKLWLSADLIDIQKPRDVSVFATSEVRGFRNVEASLIGLREGTDTPILVGEFTMTAVADGRVSRSARAAKAGVSC
jgi:hypothetical protein